MTLSLEEVERRLRVKFDSKVDRSGACHVWTGHLTHGYGYLYRARFDKVRAHRFAWELERGPIPSGMMVLHRCNNRACVNVEHLYLGVAKDNVRDAIAAGTHHRPVSTGRCRKGHEVVGRNARRGSRGHLECRFCYNANRRIDGGAGPTASTLALLKRAKEETK